jgi:hypothetical protein
MRRFLNGYQKKQKRYTRRRELMKRMIMLAMFAAALSAAVYAVPDLKFSAGAGAYFSHGDILGLKGNIFGGDITATGVGGFAFFDATFVEVDLGFSGGGLDGGGLDGGYDNGSYGAMDISLLGKYPFDVGPVTLFPLLGIDWKIALAVKDRDGRQHFSDSEVRKLGALWFQFGGGLDFSLNRNLYLRGEFLYGLRVRNELEKDAMDNNSRLDYKLGHGPTIKAAVGYRF